MITLFVSYPTATVELPAQTDGRPAKVTGAYDLVYRGNGNVLVRSSGRAYIGGHNGIGYRDMSYLVTLSLVRNDDGTVQLDPNWSSRNDIRRQHDYEVAPPSYAEKITAVIAHQVEENWDAEQDLLGAHAGVCQKLHRLESEADDKAVELAELRKQIRAEKAVMRALERKTA
jgi:hypothetical protein